MRRAPKMRISRRFTTANADPYAGIPFSKRTSRIVNPDGSVVFEARDIDMPSNFSQVTLSPRRLFSTPKIAPRTSQGRNPVAARIEVRCPWFPGHLPGSVSAA